MINQINYKSTYNEEIWTCTIKDVVYNTYMMAFTLTARESRYRCYLVSNEEKNWIAIPEMEISSELSYLDDVFWNSEQLGRILNSIIDGTSIAMGLKEIKKRMKTV